MVRPSRYMAEIVFIKKSEMGGGQPWLNGRGMTLVCYGYVFMHLSSA